MAASRITPRSVTRSSSEQRRIYVLPTIQTCELESAPRGALGMIVHATNLLVHRRLVEDIERYSDAAELIVLSPPCPVRVQPMDFGQAESLIERALDESRIANASKPVADQHRGGLKGVRNRLLTTLIRHGHRTLSTRTPRRKLRPASLPGVRRDFTWRVSIPSPHRVWPARKLSTSTLCST